MCDVCVDVSELTHAGAWRSQTSTSFLPYVFETWLDWLTSWLHVTLLLSSGIIGPCYCVWVFYVSSGFELRSLFSHSKHLIALSSPQMPNITSLKSGNTIMEGIQGKLRVFL